MSGLIQAARGVVSGAARVALLGVVIALSALAGPAFAQSAGCNYINGGGLDHTVRFVGGTVSNAGTTARVINGAIAFHSMQAVAGYSDPTYGTAPFSGGPYGLYPGDVINLTTVTTNATNLPAAITAAIAGGSGGVGISGNGTQTANYAATAATSQIGVYTYRQDNGMSADIAVTVTCTPAPAPVANAQAVSVAYNTATAITLTGSHATSYSVTTGPAHGTLSGTAPNLTYTPTAGYSGPDSFNFQAASAAGTSTAAISLTIAAPPMPAISAVSPAEGAASATTRPASVTLTGSNFSASGNVVTFAGSPASIVSQNATSLTVIPPANGAGGLADIVVTNASGQSTTLSNGYRYLLPPTVSVSFGSTTLTGAETTSFTVTVTNPNTVAIRNVAVASNGANTPFVLTAFGTFCGSGNYNASSAFGLTGIDLAAGASCTTTSTQQASAAGVFQFVTNAPTSTGTASTTVTLTGIGATSNAISSYKTPLVTVAPSPNNGPLAGGTSIAITGQNFSGATGVMVGGVPATDVTVVSNTRITATTPPGASAGLKAVAVTTPAGAHSYANGFNYIAPPAPPTVLTPTDGGVTAARPTYRGTVATGGQTVAVYVDGALVGAPSWSGLNWSLVQPTDLTGGSHTVYAIATTAAGGPSAPSATITFTVDTTPPAAPTIAQPLPITNNPIVTLTGTAEANSTVAVTANGAAVGTTTANGSGAWTLVTAALPDAAYQFLATARDGAGNVSPASNAMYMTVDTIAPAGATITAPMDNLVTDGNPTYAGTGEPNTFVDLYFNGSLTVSNIAIDAGGAWSFTFPGSGLGDGVYQMSVVARDGAGNTGPTTTGPTFTIDRAAPATPVILSPDEGEYRPTRDAYIAGTAEPNAIVTVTGSYPQVTTADSSGNWSYLAAAVSVDGPVSISVTATDTANNASSSATRSWIVDTVSPAVPVFTTPSQGQVLNTRNVSIQGTTEPFAHVNILLDGSPITGFRTDATGTFSYTAPNVADGSHTLSARAADRANNESAYSTARSFTVDATAPAFPTLTSPTPGSTISDTAPTLSGAAETGSLVTLYLNDTFLAQVTAVGGAWSYPVAGPLPDADYQVKLMALDTAFNSSGLSPAIPFRLDATAPAAPVITAPIAGAQLAGNYVLVTGTAEPLTTVSVKLDAEAPIDIAVNGFGAWDLTLSPISDGPHTVRVIATDAVGNASAAASVNFSVDATAPNAPVILNPADGAALNTGQVTITGTSEAGATVTVGLDGGAPVAAVTDAAGNWVYTYPALADGFHTFEVRAADAGGNQSLASSIGITIDATAPTAPVITAPTDGALIASGLVTVQGTAETGTTVLVSVDGDLVDTVTANGGVWTSTPTLLDGVHQITATARDAVGNVSPASAPVTLTVDATAPTAPTITSPTQNQSINVAHPTFTGTAEDGSTVTLNINGALFTTTVSGGMWSYVPTIDLQVGQNIVLVTATDVAGNVSPQALVSFNYVPITVDTTTLAAGRVGVEYAEAIQVSGGSAPYTFDRISGNLPIGLNLDRNTGVFSGTPQESGGFPIAVMVEDSNGVLVIQTYTLTINAPAAPDADPETVEVPATSAGGSTLVDLSGSVQNAASIEIVTPPAQGSVAVNGLTVVYTSQPGFFGRVTFTYKAIGFSDGNGAGAESAPATVTITLAAPTPTLGGGALTAGQIAQPYSTVLAAADGTAPYTYAVTLGALPTGLALAVDGTLSGVPTAGGTFNFTVTATDSSTGTGPFQVSAAYSLTVSAPAMSVTPAALPTATAAQPYSQSFAAVGGVAPYTYAVTAGALPAGLVLASDGALSGTPTAGGAFNFTVTATDSATGAGPSTARPTPSPPARGATTPAPPTALVAGVRGVVYSQSVSATGGVAPYTYAIASGALPTGLTLSPQGVIAGTPTATGTFTFDVRATDSATGAGPYQGVATVTLTVSAAAITVTPTTLPAVLQGTPYSQQMQATGGQGGYTFSLTNSGLPTGLSLSSSGLISGRPQISGEFSFTVTARDDFGNTGAVLLRLTVDGRPDPSADADVRALSSAQAEATRRMTGAQLDLFHRRLEALHNQTGPDQVDLNLNLDGGAFPLDANRATMGELAQATGRPGLDDRDLSGRGELTRMMDARRPEAAEAMTQGPGPANGPVQSGGLRLWAGGAIALGERDATSQTAEFRIHTSGVSAGMDMRITDSLDLGLGVGYGQERTKVGDEDSRMDADSWVGVAYGSWRPAQSVFVDGVLAYGQMTFDTRRRAPVGSGLVTGSRDGSTWFGSVSGGLDRTFGSSRWIGYGRVEAMSASLDAYAEAGSAIWALSYDARDLDSLQGALGVRYERSFIRKDYTWTPGLRLEWRQEFSEGGAQTLRYADWLDGPAYAIGQEGWGRSELNLGLTLDFKGADGWSFSTGADTRLSDEQWMASMKLMISKVF